MSQTGSEFEDLPADFPEYDLQSGEEEWAGEYYERPEPFRLRTEDFVSRPKFSKYCDLEENILEFDFSYGYDCRRPNNLVVLDEKTLVFASGNLIHFFDVDTREVWFRRCATGGGIGHITKNPVPSSYPHIAVGENGVKPPIIIYEWPSLEIMCVLRNGTMARYTHLNYSPDGKLLVSQGGDPDYMITVWNWPKSTILLRTKSYVNDVHRVMFSPEVPGHLTSCGVAHIKFWKMARTFTGLKLQGELGRFGKTEYSDIFGIYPMADEKVISGCYWGNILVWEEGLIKMEVCRKNRKRCHDGAITQLNYKDGELWTVSMDGRVRMWFYDTIDQADPPDDDRFVQMEPTYDFYTPGAMFMCIEKQYVNDPENTFYFAQDGKGGIWRIDLSTDAEQVTPSERLLKCHAGVAEDMDTCPWGQYFITLGNGGRLHVYDYVDRKLLLVYLFPAKGCRLLWVPLHIDPSGECIIASFDDGTIRICILKIHEDIKPKTVDLHILQIAKAHNKRPTVMKLSRPGHIFVSGGEDCTIFIHKVVREEGQYIKMIPIGYINTPDIPSYMLWHNFIDTTMFVGCHKGHIMTVDFPTEPVHYTTITYILPTVEPIFQRFSTYKSQIRRDQELLEIERKKEAKRGLKAEDLKQIRKDNPGLEIDSDIFLADSQSDESLGPLYIPPPSKVLFIMHTEDNTLWLSMSGYDAGYIYEYKIGQEDPIPFRCTLIHESDDIEINNYCYNRTREYLIFAMQDGSIRVNRVNPRNWRDLSNYWELTIHDNFNGFIPNLKFTYDQSHFITCGHDGNIFSFRFYPDYSHTEDLYVYEREIPDFANIKTVQDGAHYETLSIEETIVKKEVDRINFVANQHKDEYIVELQEMREEYEKLLERNAALPASQRIPQEELRVDERVEQDLEDKLSSDIALVKRKLEFDVAKAQVKMEKLKRHFIDCMDMFPIAVLNINKTSSVKCMKMRKLGEDFYDILEQVERRIAEAELKGRPPERAVIDRPKAMISGPEKPKLEYFLYGLSAQTIKHGLGAKIERLLAKYRARKAERDQRAREWAIYNSLRPSDNVTDIDDELMLKQAEATIGDFKLKSAPDYKVPRELRESTYKKYKQLLLIREKHFNFSHNFNLGVYELRAEKRAVFDYLHAKAAILRRIHEEIEVSDCLDGPKIFTIDDSDYPEREYEIRVTMPKKAESNIITESSYVQQPDANIRQREVLLKLRNMEDEEEEFDTEWEVVMHADRYRMKLFEQEEIITKMETKLKDFDEMIIKSRWNRVCANVQGTLLNLHLLTLNQELLVLKDCEHKEDVLSEIVNNKMIEMLDLNDALTDTNNHVEMIQKEMEKLAEKEKEINKSFMSAAAENKFFKFLWRIFKKKYKPPKVHTDDDSDSDSSSSDSDESEEDEDAGSIDSKDFAIVRLDENVCPKGCEQNLYDLTFQLRSQRHALEFENKEFLKQMEALRKDQEILGKKSRVLAASLTHSQEELDTFQREKQKKLNKIICTVVLKLEQIQNLNEAGKMNHIRDSILVDRSTLTKLYKRVSQLDIDTQQQTAKHKLSFSHLNRMKLDINYMMRDIEKWKSTITEIMMQKFGGRVDPCELEEYMLKQLIFDLKVSMVRVDAMYKDEIERCYQLHKEKQKALAKMFQMNTRKLGLYGMLSKEKLDLTSLLQHQDKIRNRFDNIIDLANNLKNDVKNLDNIVQEQNKELESLKKEIELFKTKGYCIRAPKEFPEQPPESEEEEDESRVSEWQYIDDYMYTEAYAKAYWADQSTRETLKARQDVIMSIVDELLENLRVEITRLDVVKLLKTVLSDIMNKVDIGQIIADLLDAIPYKLDEDQNSLIEWSAEKLFCVQDSMPLDGEMVALARSVLNQILDDILGPDTELQAEEVMPVLLNVLTENLPLDVILDEENMETIVAKIKSSPILQDSHMADQAGVIDPKQIMSNADKLETLTSKTLLNEIIEKITDLDED